MIPATHDAVVLEQIIELLSAGGEHTTQAVAATVGTSYDRAGRLLRQLHADGWVTVRTGRYSRRFYSWVGEGA